MFCKRCGTQLDEQTQFCEKCGLEIKHTIIIDSSSAVLENDYNDEENNAVNEEMQDRIGKDKSKKRKKGIIIGILALILIIAGGLVACVIGSVWRSKTANINNENNFNNGAKFAYDNSRLYVIGLYDENDDGTSLYSIDYKGINKKLISDDSDIKSIRLYKDKIYYKASKKEEYRIGVMTKNGLEDSTIVTSTQSIGKYDIYKKVLYYLQDSQIHAYKLTSQEDTIILNSVDSFTICNGYLYYASNDVICSFCIKNGKTKELCKSSGVYGLSVKDNELYFVCDTGLSSISTKGDGQIKKVIKDNSLGCYTFFNGCIYYKQKMSDDERNEMAEYMGSSSTEILQYKMALLGMGALYKSDKNGGNEESVDSDKPLIYTLYNYPKGLYCSPSLWSYNIEPIDLD